MKYDILDLNILKTILTNKLLANEFASFYEATLFKENIRLFAKLVIDYVRAFKIQPTARTLSEYHSAHKELIEECFSILDKHEYNEVEYAFDVVKIKERYEEWELDDIRKSINEKSKSNAAISKDIALKIQNIQSLKNGRSYIQRTVKEHMPRFKEKYVANAMSDTSEAIKTFYSGIDYATDGILPAEMVIIGAETAGGKSILLSNMATQMWLQENNIYKLDNFSQGYNVLFLSLEMPYEDCFSRFLARLADVPQRSIIKGTLTDEEREKVAQAEKFIEAYPYEFEIVDVPRDLNINELELRFNDAMLKYKPHIVVVDYLSLMDSKNSKEQDWLRLGYLAGQLHEFARAHNVIVLTAVQLTDINRNSKTDPKKRSEEQTVGTHRVGRSSLILHHANLFIQLEKRPGEMAYPDLKYHIVKNRKGPLLQGLLKKHFENGALYDKTFTRPNQISSDDEDIGDKIRKLKDDGEDEE